MKKKPSYHADLLKRLKNPRYATLYLNEAVLDEDSRVFLLALHDVVKAHGSMTKLSRRTKISREHIYRILSKKGNPELKTLQTLLGALGLRISIASKSQTKRAA